METSEQFFPCPFCGTQISMLLDLSEPSQRFIEDCERCCRPIEVFYRVEDDAVIELDVARSGE